MGRYASGIAGQCRVSGDACGGLRASDFGLQAESLTVCAGHPRPSNPVRAARSNGAPLTNR